MTVNEARVLVIGSQPLVDFYDAIWREQRKRWNAPDWREQPWSEADFVNAKDTAVALASLGVGS